MNVSESDSISEELSEAESITLIPKYHSTKKTQNKRCLKWIIKTQFRIRGNKESNLRIEGSQLNKTELLPCGSVHKRILGLSNPKTGHAVFIAEFITDVSMAPYSNSQVSYSLYSRPKASKLDKEENVE